MDKDEDDPEFSSRPSTTQRTHTDIVEDLLTQLSKVEGYSQILHEEFGGQQAPGAARGGSRIQSDFGDEDDDLQIEVAKLVIDAEDEKAPHVPTDLSTRVVFVSRRINLMAVAFIIILYTIFVPRMPCTGVFRMAILPWRRRLRNQSTTVLHMRC